MVAIDISKQQAPEAETPKQYNKLFLLETYSEIETQQYFSIYSTALKWGSFSEKISKKHLCHHDKNYCYFGKSNIPVINLIVASRNMIKFSKNMRL